MSLGYAENLSYREDVGIVGQKEILDDVETVKKKSYELADMIQQASKVVIMTGAGISTSAGIPDFRGPRGVWTCQKHGLPLPALQTPFVAAKPTYTHMAILELVMSGKVTYVVSQNVDGLHRRSGLGAHHVAEVHGNCFMEHCPACRRYYLRDFEMHTVGFAKTGRACCQPQCRGRLVDFVLDWDNELPEEQLLAAEQRASEADLILALGTSLQIRPICNLPLRTKRAGGKIVIVNLQKTTKHRSADLVVHSYCDDVMRHVFTRMKWRLPPYMRWDQFSLRAWGVRAKKAVLIVAIGSVHGYACPLPMLETLSWIASNSVDALLLISQNNDKPVTCTRSSKEETATVEPAVKRKRRDCERATEASISTNTRVKSHCCEGMCNDLQGPLAWRTVSPSLNSPMLLSLDSNEDFNVCGTLYIRLQFKMKPSADPGYQVHDLVLRVDSDGRNVHASCMKAERSWGEADATALQIKLLTQVHDLVQEAAMCAGAFSKRAI